MNYYYNDNGADEKRKTLISVFAVIIIVAVIAIIMLVSPMNTDSNDTASNNDTSTEVTQVADSSDTDTEIMNIDDTTEDADEIRLDGAQSEDTSSDSNEDSIISEVSAATVAPTKKPSSSAKPTSTTKPSSTAKPAATTTSSSTSTSTITATIRPVVSTATPTSRPAAMPTVSPTFSPIVQPVTTVAPNYGTQSANVNVKVTVSCNHAVNMIFYLKGTPNTAVRGLMINNTTNASQGWYANLDSSGYATVSLPIEADTYYTFRVSNLTYTGPAVSNLEIDIYDTSIS